MGGDGFACQDQGARLSDERSSSLPPARLAGDPAWSAAAGGLAGLLGGLLALVVAVRLGAHFPVGGLGPNAVWSAARVSTIMAVAGGLIGALFGRLTRRLFPWVPRLAFGLVFTGTLWLLLYAFVLGRFAPRVLETVPFAPSLIGTLVCGVCIGLMPPVRARGERGRRP